jgi:protein-tyrosine phosphatase
MMLKRPLRNVVWRVKGGSVQNPVAPALINSALFVCLGNICRSPFAALLADRMMREAGWRGVQCTSAGIRPSQGRRSPDEAVEAAAAYGIRLDHVPQLLTREMITTHDVTVVMEAAHFERLRHEYPEFRARIVLLSLFDDRAKGAYDRLNIADPFGQPLPVFTECYRRIDMALRRWLASLPAR